MRLHLADNLSRGIYYEKLIKSDYHNLLFSYLGVASDWENILKSYHNCNVIIDSGAYSAWTQKTKISRNAYLNFCKSARKIIKNIYFVNLDVIPGDYGRKPTKDEIEESAQKGWENMEWFENNNLKVIHVFHQYEDFKWLDKLVKYQEYIGISPANDITVKARIKWLDKVFHKIKATRKTHGFGATAKRILYRYPWFSCDSTSWKAPSIYGRSITIDFNKIGIINRKPTFWTKQQIGSEINRWKLLEKNATKIWKLREITWEN